MKAWQWIAISGALIGGVVILSGKKGERGRDDPSPDVPSGQQRHWDSIVNRLNEKWIVTDTSTALFIRDLSLAGVTSPGAIQSKIDAWRKLCKEIGETRSSISLLIGNPVPGGPTREHLHLLDAIMSRCGTRLTQLDVALRDVDSSRGDLAFILSTWRTLIKGLDGSDCKKSASLLTSWIDDYSYTHGVALLALVKTGKAPGPEIWQGLVSIDSLCKGDAELGKIRQRLARILKL